MHHEYREHEPHAALSDVVECYWTIEAEPGEGETANDLVLPDGCIDIIFDVSGGHRGATPEEPHVVGTMTRGLPVETAAPLRLWGVRFRPGGAGPFVPVPAHELTDASVSLDSVWGSESARIWERLSLAEESGAAISLLDSMLRRVLDRRRDRLDEAVLSACRIGQAAPGRVSVDGLAELVGLGRRQLERRYRDAVGVGPKLACSIARFRSVICMLHAEPHTPLSQLAFRAGYADQPHMSREFKRLAGVTPGAYRRSVELLTHAP